MIHAHGTLAGAQPIGSHGLFCGGFEAAVNEVEQVFFVCRGGGDGGGVGIKQRMAQEVPVGPDV